MRQGRGIREDLFHSPQIFMKRMDRLSLDLGHFYAECRADFLSDAGRAFTSAQALCTRF